MSESAQATLWDAWRPLAQKALKGAPLESLSTTTPDGLALDPLYAPAEPSFLGRARHGPWQVVARVDGREPARQAREDLENGASALSLVFAGAPGAHGRGLVAATVEELDAALHGVLVDIVPVWIEAGARGIGAFALFTALAERHRARPAAVHAGIDPIGALVASGSMAADARGPRLADAVRAFANLRIDGTALLADGRVVAEAGATPVTELAFALHALAGHLRALDAEGVAPATALPLVAMALSASEDQFATIAKLRAARRLHRLVADACGVDATLTLGATTLHRMLSFSDPQTNLLRLTIAAFAAGVGGADAVTVLPFDQAGSPFARRMARNIETLLVEEAHVARLDDPGAGSGAVEAYTDALAEAAWDLFQRMEAARGDDGLGFITDGSLARLVADDAARAEAAVRAGERAILGVTVHTPKEPNPIADAERTEQPAATRHAPAGTRFSDLVAAAGVGATLADLDPPGASLAAPPVRPQRASTPFGG